MTAKPTYEELERRIQELQVSEMYSRTLLENVNDAVLVHEIGFDGKPGKFIDANSVALNRLGYTHDELLKLTPKDITTENGYKDLSEVRTNITSNYSAIFETIHLTRNGSTIPVESNVSIVELAGQRVAVSVVRDLVESKRAEAALKMSEEKYRALFESSKDPVYISTLEGTVMDANPSFLALFGYTKEDLGQLKTQDLYVNPDNRAKFIKELNKSGFVKDYLEKLQSKSGVEMDCQVTVTDRRTVDGDIIGYQGTIRDISEVRRKELEKEQLISDLQDALAEVKKLSGLLPICMHCKKIRNDKGYWNHIETYIQEHSDAEFSHSICRDCAERYYPDIDIYDD